MASSLRLSGRRRRDSRPETAWRDSPTAASRRPCRSWVCLRSHHCSRRLELPSLTTQVLLKLEDLQDGRGVPEGREQLRTGGCESAFWADSARKTTHHGSANDPESAATSVCAWEQARTTRSPLTLAKHLVLGLKSSLSRSFTRPLMPLFTS